MSATPAKEGQVVSVLAELAQRTEHYASTLAERLAAADTVRQSITQTLDRLQQARARWKQARADVSEQGEVRDLATSRAAEAGEVVDRAARRLKELNQMMDYGIEDQQLFDELGRAQKAHDDKTLEREKWRKNAAAAQEKVARAESLMAELTIEIDKRAAEARALQKELPDPHLFAYLGMSHFGRAHSNFLLDGDASKFDRNMRQGIETLRRMHQELREGRYRLDRYGDLLAGRHESTVQALYGAVALGDVQLARDMFALAADPSMFFHSIFNVFRVWALGATLMGDARVVQQLLQQHRYEPKLWGGYVRCFRAIHGRSPAPERELNSGLQSILRYETRRDDLAAIPGGHLIHLPALALCRLATQKRIRVLVKDERLPPALMKW
jgi:hypothetical protein